MADSSAPQANDELIVHLCTMKSWQESRRRGKYHASSLDVEGFIHASRPDQIMRVANAFYREVPDMVVMWIDPSKVVAEIRWEDAGEDIFPHIYGELNMDAVIGVSNPQRSADGSFLSL